MKGIIMGAENVRAILDGRKTQTRRVVKPQPLERSRWVGWLLDSTGREDDKRIGSACWRCDSIGGDLYVKPRYKVGEIVYVKETWGIDTANCFNVYQGGKGKTDYEISYKAGGIKTITFEGDCEDDPHERYYDSQIGDWHSPMYMPEKYSRIHLEITDIKAQRVQDITEEEAMAEGIRPMYTILPGECTGLTNDAVDEYADLWDSLNAKRGYPWESNPWVFAYTFKVVEEGK